MIVVQSAPKLLGVTWDFLVLCSSWMNLLWCLAFYIKGNRKVMGGPLQQNSKKQLVWSLETEPLERSELTRCFKTIISHTPFFPFSTPISVAPLPHPTAFPLPIKQQRHSSTVPQSILVPKSRMPGVNMHSFLLCYYPFLYDSRLHCHLGVPWVPWSSFWDNQLWQQGCIRLITGPKFPHPPGKNMWYKPLEADDFNEKYICWSPINQMIQSPNLFA